MRSFTGIGAACGISFGLFVGLLEHASAQVIPDDTLGAEGSELLPREAGGLQIEGGAVRGESLFHSFTEFSIDTGEVVYFANPAEIETILGRVTGDVRSDILGRLGVDGNASLYLINPNGVVFGPEAQLDMAGSLFISTAPSFDLGGGFSFSAVEPTTVPLLTINVTPGLQLGQDVSGAIIASGATLSVGDELTLVSDVVELEGGLLEANGDLLVRANQLLLRDGAFIISEAGTEAGGDIAIEVGTLLLEEGANILSTSTGEGTGGDVIIRASESVTLRSSDPVNFASIRSVVSAGATGDAGDLSITADELALDNGASITSDAFSESTGNVGDLTVNVRRLLAEGGSIVSSLAGSEGAGGALTIRASESIVMNGSSLGALAVEGSGDAGDLSITADTLSLTDSDILSSTSFESIGNAGDLTIDVGRLVAEGNSLISSATNTEGDGGSLTIRASESIALNSSTISSASFDGAGDAGDVSITADTFFLDGGSFIQSNAFSELTSNAGDLTINVRRLIAEGGSIISSAAFSDAAGGTLTIRATESIAMDASSFESAAVEGAGDAGDLSITAGELWLNNDSFVQGNAFAASTGNAGDLGIDVRRLIIEDGSAISSSTFSEGAGGVLTIRASESIAMNAGAIAAAAVAGAGDAGNLIITTGELSLDEGSRIQSNAFPESTGDAGDLTIDVRRLVAGNSAITSSTASDGAGGVLSIRASGLIAMNASTILSSAIEGAGDAGVLAITADELFLDAGSSIQSSVFSASTGNAGNLTIDVARNLTLANGSIISSETAGVGNAGNLTIRALESVELRGEGQAGVPSLILTEVRPNATGDARNLMIATGRLLLEDGTRISTSSLGAGEAGFLRIEATEEVFITDESFLAAITAGGGPVGGLSITTPQLTVQDSGRLLVSSEGDFPAGTLTVNADQIRLSDLASLRAETEAGDEGNITLNAEGILLQDDSSITTSATKVATGGSIDINALSFLLLLDRSRVDARASEGQGGNINITTELFLQSEGSVIDASSALGVDGTVNFEVVETDVPTEAEALPTTFARAELDQRCVSSQSALGTSRFIRTGRGGLPVDADATGNAGLWEDLRFSEPGVEEAQSFNSVPLEAIAEPSANAESVVEAQDWHRTEAGLVVLTADSMSVTPYSALRTRANCQAG